MTEAEWTLVDACIHLVSTGEDDNAEWHLIDKIDDLCALVCRLDVENARLNAALAAVAESRRKP